MIALFWLSVLLVLAYLAVRAYRQARIREALERFVCRQCGIEDVNGVDAGCLPHRVWLCRPCADCALGRKRAA